MADGVQISSYEVYAAYKTNKGYADLIKWLLGGPASNIIPKTFAAVFEATCRGGCPLSRVPALLTL